MAGKQQIPAIVREFSDAQMMEIAVIENVQRKDLTPIEEALGYQTLLEEFELTQAELGDRIGKSRSSIANTLRLLNLPPEIQKMVGQGRLSAGHARALLGLDDQQAQLELARQVLEEEASVRTVETWVDERGEDREKKQREEETSTEDEPNTQAPEMERIEGEMRDTLGAPVSLQGSLEKGKLVIEFFEREELMRVFEIICSD